MDPMQTLVIILSITLAIFLVLAIILTVMMIRVTMQIQRMTNTAEEAVDNLSEFASNATKASSLFTLGRMFANKLNRTKK